MTPEGYDAKNHRKTIFIPINLTLKKITEAVGRDLAFYAWLPVWPTQIEQMEMPSDLHLLYLLDSALSCSMEIARHPRMIPEGHGAKNSRKIFILSTILILKKKLPKRSAAISYFTPDYGQHR